MFGNCQTSAEIRTKNILYHSIAFLDNALRKLVCPLGIEGNAISMMAAEENALTSVILKPSKAALEYPGLIENTLCLWSVAHLRIFTLRVTWVGDTAVVSFPDPGG